MKTSIIKRWQFWALLIVILVFAVDIADHLTNFPVRLGMLRVGVLFAEQVWTKMRLLQ